MSKTVKSIEVKRFQIYDPRIKRMITKSFSKSKYNDDEIDELGEKWKIEQKKLFDEFKDPKNKLQNEIKSNIPPIGMFREFQAKVDPKSKEGGVSFLLLGSTKAGKTQTMKYLVDEYFSDYINILFSNSLQSEKYKELKKKYITSKKYLPDVVKECYKINEGTNNKYNFNIILDDIIDEKNDEEVKKLLLIYRNSNISCIINAQTATIISSAGRSNINYILFFRMNSDGEIEKIMKEFLNSYMPRNMNMIEKIAYYRELTKDYNFIFLNTLDNIICRSKIIL